MYIVERETCIKLKWKPYTVNVDVFLTGRPMSSRIYMPPKATKTQGRLHFSLLTDPYLLFQRKSSPERVHIQANIMNWKALQCTLRLSYSTLNPVFLTNKPKKAELIPRVRVAGFQAHMAFGSIGVPPVIDSTDLALFCRLDSQHDRCLRDCGFTVQFNMRDYVCKRHYQEVW